MLVFGVLSAVSFLMNYKKIDTYGYPIAILALGVISFVLLSMLSPSLYSTLTGRLSIFVPSETALTVAEVHPMHVFGTSIGNPGAWEWFTTTFFIAFAAFPWIGYNIARKFRPEEILFIVWSAVMLYACFGQNRFAAYYAVNVAILCGFVSWKIIEFVGFRGEGRVGEAWGAGENKRVKGKKKGGAGGGNARKAKLKAKTTDKEVRTKTEKIKQYLRAELIFTFIIIFFVVFYPPLFMPTGSLSSARGGGGPEYDWYEALSWMGNNTPEPGVSYYDLYEEPPHGEDYDYPEGAYGVMSWWDYGHWITRIAHRIPNANPFQAGIGGPGENGTIRPGACMFLTSNDEREANWILDELDTRYVVSDFMMADARNAYYNKFGAITTWAGRGYPNYYYTMELRLHMFDGARVEVEGENIPALAHYRLVHESRSFILPYILMDMNTGYAYWRHFSSADYKSIAQQAQILHGHLFSMPAGAWIEDDLNKEVVPEMLKNTFDSAGIPLSEDSAVVKENEDRWTIRDIKNENVFSIEKKEGELNVYIYGVKIGKNAKAWTPEYIQPVSFVKVFEYVKGAKIEGTAPNGSIVEIATNITTNRGREFVYSARKISDGAYEFIVPYSTEGTIEGGTNFDVFALPYKIRVGHIENATVVWDVEKEVSVPEEAVMEGKTIRVDV